MKIILTSAIIAFCGVLQIAADDAPTMLELRHELIEKQITILNVSEPLLELQKSITASDDVIETSREFKANLTTLFNDARKAIEDQGKAAIANGKSVGACVDQALANLTALRKAAFAEYAQAGENITRFTIEFLRQTDDALEVGRTIATHLFAIPTICHKNTTHPFATCFIDLMKNTTEGVEAYRTAANNVLAAAESGTTLFSVLELVFEWAFALTEISEKTDAGFVAIQNATTACIDAQQIKQNNPPPVGLLGISLNARLG